MDAALKKELGRMNVLGMKRNWTHFMINGIVGSLRYLQKEWPGIEVRPALFALMAIQEGIDAMWWDKREQLKLMMDREALDGTVSVVGDGSGCGDSNDRSKLGPDLAFVERMVLGMGDPVDDGASDLRKP